MSQLLDLFEPFAIVVLLLFGLAQLLLAAGAARLPLGLLRLPERKAAELREERVQLHGSLVPLGEPLHTLSGEPVVLLETALISPSKRDNPLTVKRWGRVGLSDASGTVELDLDGVILWRESRATTLDREGFRASFPDLWNACGEGNQSALSFTVDQRYLPAGQSAFVAGEAMPGAQAAEAGYRGAPTPKLVVAAGVGLPLVVACRPRGAVVAHLLAPTFRHALAAFAAFALALVVVGYDRWVAAAAGL